jgi:NADPH:quinone reductase-like Zn-dependent oxidoreductase
MTAQRSMKAVVHDRYGSPDEVLQVREIAIPAVGDDHVLVRVRAASAHVDVWHVVTGIPYVVRVMGNGVRRPKFQVPGTDLAGVVEAVGRNVTRFTPGDEVFGESVSFGWKNGGTFAEYAAVPQELLALKPSNVTFEQAAAVPTSGYIALINVRGSGPLAGRRVLINGAGGSVGTLATQIAKADGAHVTAIDRAEKLPMLRSLGADRVVDYEKEDVLRSGERYDFILDVASTWWFDVCAHLLTPTGTYMPIGHGHFGRATGRMGGRIVGGMPAFVGLLVRALADPEKRRNFKTMPSKGDAIAIFTALLASGQVTPIVARTFPLGDVRTAMRCIEDTRIPGRIILTP